jgi:hypothetical protein
MLAVERRLVESAAARRGEGVAVVAREHVDRALAERGTIAEEQAAMVRSLVGSGDGVEVMRAAAGTGKTFALDAARAAWEAEGVRVYGCALSAGAAADWTFTAPLGLHRVWSPDVGDGRDGYARHPHAVAGVVLGRVPNTTRGSRPSSSSASSGSRATRRRG